MMNRQKGGKVRIHSRHDHKLNEHISSRVEWMNEKNGEKYRCSMTLDVVIILSRQCATVEIVEIVKLKWHVSVQQGISGSI